MTAPKDEPPVMVNDDAVAATRLQRTMSDLARALDHENVLVRVAAAQTLRGLDDARAAAPLSKAMKDVWRSVRIVSGEALVSLRSEGGIAAFDIGELSAADRQARTATASSLASVRVAAYIAGLKDEDRTIRLASAEVLGETRATAAVTPLVNALGDEAPEYSQKCAKRWSALASLRFRSFSTPSATATGGVATASRGVSTESPLEARSRRGFKASEAVMAFTVPAGLARALAVSAFVLVSACGTDGGRSANATPAATSPAPPFAPTVPPPPPLPEPYRFVPKVNSSGTTSQYVEIEESTRGLRMTGLTGGKLAMTTPLDGKGTSQYMPDAPGSHDIHVIVNKEFGYTTFAGLRFQEPAVVGVRNDGLVVVNKEGVRARDAKDRPFISGKIKVEDKDVIAMLGPIVEK